MKHRRINLIYVLFFLFGAAIVGRLVFLQIIQHDFYAALARGQQKFFITTQGERGKIFFQNHNLPIASDQNYTYVYASPNEIPAEKKEEIAKILANLLGLDEKFILEKLTKDSLYELLKEKLGQEEIEQFKTLALAGFYLGQERVRYYPFGEFASHLLGFVNKDGQGQYGTEEYWNDVLAGKNQFWEGERGPLGYLFSNKDKEILESKGSDLFLIVDYNIQHQAEELLKKAEKQLNIEGGTIMVIDPHSGKILALADSPNFDPNQYSKEADFKIFQTDAIQKIFEPGSVFKPITMASALNEKAITLETTYRDPGMIEIGGWPIYNYEQRIYSGKISMTEVLEKSINTGAVFAESQLGHSKFTKYLEKFGIFEKTGVDLAGEVFSQNREFKKGYEVNFATASFGQGIEMTPIQLLRAFSAIANGGRLIQPYLVEKIKSSNNKITEIQPKMAEDNIISAESALALTTMLVSVVENGFGKAAKIPGYYIAGKTGTAQISFSALDLGSRGYSEKTWQSFAGFAPAFDPQFLILVKLNNPAAKTAEYSAVPIFRELAKYIIDYWKIPPDYENFK